jgi:hypothetical protein
MSDKYFCKYLSGNNIGFLLNIIDKTNKYHLWDSCGYVFYDSLCEELFLNDDSHLSKETEFRGVGLHKPISRALFESLELLENYRPFQSFSSWKETNFKVDIINKYISGLEIALKKYFSKARGICYAGSASTALSVAIDYLAGILETITMRIGKCQDDEIYYNKQHDAIMEIEMFYDGTLHHLLAGTSNYSPEFADEEVKIMKDSLAEGIVDSIFKYLEALTYLEHDEYARHLSTALLWLIFPVSEDRPEIIKNMEEKLLTLLKERVEENKQGHYSSMIKLLINLYGFLFCAGVKDNIKIGKYIEGEFINTLAENILNDPVAMKRYLPRKHTANITLGIIKDMNGNIMYQRPTPA